MVIFVAYNEMSRWNIVSALKKNFPVGLAFSYPVVEASRFEIKNLLPAREWDVWVRG